MTTRELTDVYADPPVRTVGELITWRRFWRIYNERDGQPWTHSDVRTWMRGNMAFGNDGARMIER